jgi:hypothetical protein
MHPQLPMFENIASHLAAGMPSPPPTSAIADGATPLSANLLMEPTSADLMELHRTHNKATWFDNTDLHTPHTADASAGPG